MTVDRRKMLRLVAFAVAGLLAVPASAQAGEEPNASPLRLVASGFVGTGGTDRIDSVVFDSDGGIWVAGNLGEPLKSLPGSDVKLNTLGETPKGWTYGCGFVARFSADGSKVLAFRQFAPGVLKLTSVAVTKDAVYAAGYGSPAMAKLLGEKGLMTSPEGRFKQRSWRLFSPREHWTDPRYDKRNDQRGVPVVIRFRRDLSRITAGTYLEGWQTVWHVPRPLGEDWWQPVGLAVLSDGDVVVSHDGGYNTAPLDDEKLGYERFYHVPDYVSRLSGDLTARRWKKILYMPQIDLKRARRFLHAGRTRHCNTPPRKWPYDSIGQTRILRLRSDANDNLYLCGYSPSRTSQEPWWCPFLLKWDPNGKRLASPYTPDPMTGPKGRLYGDVSDSCIYSVAPDGEGNILACTIADGGNSILRKDPRDMTRDPKTPDGRKIGLGVGGFRGRTLFWGPVVKISGKTQGLLGGHRVYGNGRRGVKPAWGVDICPLPGGRTLVAGRYSSGFGVTDEDWPVDQEDRSGSDNRRRRARLGPVGNGFIRLYDGSFDMEFSGGVEGFVPVTVASQGRRIVIVGRASSSPPVKEFAFPEAAGRQDGYIMILEVRE